LVKHADEVVGEHELSEWFPNGGHEEPDDIRHDPDAVYRDADDRALFLSRARVLGLQ
jgi:hypothetical protein